MDISAFNAFIKKLKIFQTSPTIYDPITGFIEFGPYGSTIKNNMISEVKKYFRKNMFWEVEFPIVSPVKVWQASGHYDKFVDIIGKSDGKIYRIDKLIEEEYPDVLIEGKSLEYFNELIKTKSFTPKGNKEPIHNLSEYYLMLQTKVAGQDAVLRPETATSTYLGFKDYYALFRNSMPIKVFQFGKVYRNEVTSRQGLIRSREFEQIEGQIFLTQEEKKSFKDLERFKDYKCNLLSHEGQVKGEAPSSLSISEALEGSVLPSEGYAYCFGIFYELIKGLGFKDEQIRFRQHLIDERAHYAIDAWDVEVRTAQYSWVEICGIHDRGNYDLTQHQEYSGKKMSIRDENGEDQVPTILEIAIGVGRLLYCLLEKSFVVRDEKNVLFLPPKISPINVAVFPLVKKGGLPEIAMDIYNELIENDLIVFFDNKGSIGKRYARMDELGTPYCITVDFDTLTDNCVTLRDRTDMNQVRVPISEIAAKLKAQFS